MKNPNFDDDLEELDYLFLDEDSYDLDEDLSDWDLYLDLTNTTY